MAFLNETGLQELRTRLEAVYARKANITAGTAGETTDTSGTEITIPYVTMNAQGVVTGYGTKTHIVPTPEPTVSAPTITYTQESTSTDYDRSRWAGTYTMYRHKVTVTRVHASGTTYYWGYFNGTFTGGSVVLYTPYTAKGAGNTVQWVLCALTDVSGSYSNITVNGATTSGTACSCSCTCGCNCDCDCSRD